MEKRLTNRETLVDNKCCSCINTTSSTSQTLDELDFERGIWKHALDGDIDGIRKQLQKGKDVNAKDSSGYSALHYASRNGHLAACRLLLREGACVNAQTPGGATSLHRAAFMGHDQVVDLLLRSGGNPAIIDSDGRNTLHKAAENGLYSVCRMLLMYCGNLKFAQDHRGNLPLNYVKETSAEVLSLLSSDSNNSTVHSVYAVTKSDNF